MAVAPYPGSARCTTSVFHAACPDGPALEGVKKMQGAMLDQQQLSEEEKASAKEIMAASMKEVEKAMSWGNIETIMVNAYAEVFTTKELTDLNALFLSPAGQTFVEKQPELQAATMKEMQSIMMDLMPKIQKRTEEAIERVKNQQN